MKDWPSLIIEYGSDVPYTLSKGIAQNKRPFPVWLTQHAAFVQRQVDLS